MVEVLSLSGFFDVSHSNEKSVTFEREQIEGKIMNLVQNRLVVYFTLLRKFGRMFFLFVCLFVFFIERVISCVSRRFTHVVLAEAVFIEV